MEGLYIGVLCPDSGSGDSGTRGGKCGSEGRVPGDVPERCLPLLVVVATAAMEAAPGQATSGTPYT
jgi:hypothetical protein